MDNYVCPICLDNIEIKREQDNNVNIIVLKGCRHVYHKKCLKLYWKNVDRKRCPLCRDENVTDDLFFNNWITKNNRLKLDKYNKYLIQWHNRDCIENNHFIIFVKPFGVIGICLNCKRVESFNV